MDPVISTQIADQIAMQMEGIKSFIWFVSIINTIFLALASLYGYWIWDVHKKVGSSVSGADCELRNDKHYADVENLRLEIKGDSEKLGDGFSKDLARASKERDAAIFALKEQVVAFMDKSSSQHQSNFEVLVQVLRDIGCDNKEH